MKYIDQWGDEMELTFYRGEYVCGGTALIAFCDEGEYAVPTKWLAPVMEDQAYMDMNNCKHLVEFMVNEGYLHTTDQYAWSGFCTYPLVNIDREWLESLEVLN